MGAAQDWRWHASGSDAPRLADCLSRRLPTWPGATPALCYSAGVLVLSHEFPQEILYRSAEPVLKPELLSERKGVVSNVVFPTAIDRRDDIGQPDRLDVYYGMADQRIRVARLDVPSRMPPAQPTT
jgi:predicted GH43/DUF377 family glycosyl hydrolase